MKMARQYFLQRGITSKYKKFYHANRVFTA